MGSYSWTDASAMWQIQHGDSDSDRTRSALTYLERRLSEGVVNGDMTYKLTDSE